MNYFIANFDFALGISSIGLDGEELDQVNFMEKPEIFVRKGDYVASAEDTLINFTCRYEIVKETDIYTSIGKIVIVKIKENGKALVAGPARVNDMLMVVSILNEFLDVGKILIDGAFSRQVFSKVTQATVLVIGANYDRNIDNVVDNAKSLYNKFNLPIITNFPFSFSEKIQLLTNSNNLKLLDYSSIIGKVEDFFNEDLENVKAVYFPKSITNKFVEKLIDLRNQFCFDIILDSSINIQVNNGLLEKLFKLKNKLYVVNKITIPVVCFNPYSPQGYTFQCEEFEGKLEKALNRKVFNVLKGDYDE